MLFFSGVPSTFLFQTFPPRIINRKIAAHGSWRIHERLVITYASYRLTLFAFRVKHISLLRNRSSAGGITAVISTHEV